MYDTHQFWVVVLFFFGFVTNGISYSVGCHAPMLSQWCKLSAEYVSLPGTVKQKSKSQHINVDRFSINLSATKSRTAENPIMENVLEQYDSDDESSHSSFNKSQEIKEDHSSSFNRQVSSTSEDIETDEKDFEDAALAMAIEENLLKSEGDNDHNDSVTNGTAGDNGANDSGGNSSEDGAINSSKSEADNANASANSSDIKTEDEKMDEERTDGLSFDEDIILPGPRRDSERDSEKELEKDLENDQKERDRLKRKEIKSKKELEEEEREKMQ